MILPNHLERIGGLAGLAITAALILGACWRADPPEVPEFRVPAARSAAVRMPEQVDPGPVPVAAEMAPVEAPPPPPPPPPPKVNADAAAPPPAVPAAGPASNTIVGTWRVTEMMEGGEQEMPPGASMILTFNADGSMSLSMGMEGMPEPMTMAGSYTVNGNQLTMTIAEHPETKTGTFSVDGNTLTINVDDTVLKATRM